MLTLAIALLGTTGAFLLLAETARADAVTVMDARLPAAAHGSSAVSDGTHAYVFGGWLQSGILRYDPATDTISPMQAKLPTPRHGTSAVWTGTHAYIFGGWDGNRPYLDEILRYDPATDQLTRMAAKLPSIRYFTSAVWDGTHAYVFGGFGFSYSNQIVRYDPVTDTATVVGALPFPLAFMSAAWDGTSAYIFGGDSPTYRREIIRFEPATGAVSVVAQLPDTRHASSAVWDGAQAYVFAGSNDRGYQRDVVRFTPSTREVAVTDAPLPSGFEHASAAWDGRNAYVFGGAQPSGLRDQILRYSTFDAPLVTAASLQGPIGDNGWFRGDVTVTLTATGGAGGAATRYALDGGAFREYDGPFTVSGDALHELRFGSTDGAGSVEETHVLGIAIDASPPILAASRSPDANALGWNNGAVTVAFACTDAASGVAEPPAGSVVVSEEGADQSRSASCTDAAGNRASATVGDIRIDLTAPRADLATRCELPGKSPWCRSASIAFEGAGSDALSGVASVECALDGAAVDCLGAVAGEGAHRLRLDVSDAAGNTAAAAADLSIDSVAPAARLWRPDGGSVFVDDVRVHVEGDSLGIHTELPVTVVVGRLTVVAEASDATSGLEVLTLSIDGAPRGLTSTGVLGFYSMPWRADEEALGEHHLLVRVEDAAGNPTDLPMRVLTAPTTEAGVQASLGSALGEEGAIGNGRLDARAARSVRWEA